MSDSAADAGTAEFTHLWLRVPKICGSKIQNTKTEQHISTAEMSPQRNGFQSPKAINCMRFTGFNYGDSPGDVEPSQDIIWDSTSPTAATSGNTGHRNTRVVEISDIVNRIAPKEKQQQGAESPLLQWIGDSVPSTPDIPKHRGRRKSSRQNTVEDLVKLARQFDKKMQDRESSEGVPTLRSADKMQPLQCPSSSDRVEAELQALFDCSTQRVSGRLSQGSPASSCSQEVKDQPAAAPLEPSRQTGPSYEKSVPAAGLKATALRSNNDFDDDWENDELLNDPLLLEITHNPPQLQGNSQASSQTNTKRESEQSYSGFQSAKMACGRQPSAACSELTCSTLQELCPKLKTTNRSTFKLEPNLHFQAKDLSRPALTPLRPKAQISPINPTTSKTQPDEAASSKTDARGCGQGASDSQWEDGDDDSLLYQVCDSIERTSKTQLDRLRSSPKNQHSVAERAQRGTTPVSIDAGASSRAQRELPRSFVRSNSLPATNSGAGTYRGWDCPMRGASSKPLMSQSLPGSHMTLGTFTQSRDWSGKLQTGIDGASKAGMVTARTAHPAFKRNFSDSAVPSNKVFITNQMAGKCSAAEIERKKQEALARRRQRMQHGPKP